MAKLTGPQKAAIVLLTLGDKASAMILKNLTANEIKQLGEQMSSFDGIKKEVSDEVLHEFNSQFSGETDIHAQGEQFFRNLLPDVIGNENATQMISVMEKEKEQVPFKYVREIDARVLANFIKNEHPQTIAVIMVYLGYEKASQVLGCLPDTLQFEVVNRVAHLESVPPDLVKEVDEVLEKELLSIGHGSAGPLGGVDAVAEILNHSDGRTSENILQSMEDYDGDLADKVRKLMFVFEDLVTINDQGVRDLLREIKNEELTLALKTASEELKNKIFKNLSQRAVQMLEEEISLMGPVRLSDVEIAQQSILNAARRLEREGKIALAGREGGDTFV
ncbi:MAG: flagellar motor switch protein FliG [Syntrophobacteraceae bacterium]